MAIIDKIQLSGTVYTIGNETTTAVTSASTDNEIPTAKAVYDAIPQGGGGKAIEAGRGISITTGETADTVSFSLPISAGTGANSIVMGEKATANGAWSFANGNGNIFNGTSAAGDRAIAIGYVCEANGNTSIANGQYCTANGIFSHAIGSYLNALNDFETSIGKTNVSNKANDAFGNSGNTLFSIGNGGLQSQSHNAFQIMQNGDIYIADTNDTSTTNYYEKPMIKLQDALGGGGIDSGTVQTMIDNSLSGYVYTADNGKQDIYGSKTFIGNKKISFTQAGSNDKLGFTLYDVRDEQGNAKEFGAFELNPTGITENGVTHPLLTLNHYRGNNGRNVQTYIGYRQYDYPHSAAYHLLAPLPENAKTPFGLTTNFQNFYMPLGIKVNNSTMVKADSGGVVNLTDAFNGKLDVFRYDTYTAATDTAINSKASQSDLSTLSGTVTAHTANTDIHVTTAQTAAWNAKSDFSGSYNDLTNKLSAGTGISIVDNVISATGGGGGGVDVVQTTGTSTTDVMSQNAVTTQLNNKLASVQYRNQSWAGNGITSIDTSNNSSSYTTITFVGSINNKPILTGNDYTKVNNFNLVEASAITTSVTSSSTDSQVPSAKAVNDKLGGLSLVKLTQSEYDNLSTRDSNTLYIING